MHVHVEVRVYELPRLADPARHGRWGTIELWDKSKGQLLATHSHRFGDVETPVDPLALQAEIGDVAEKLVRFIGLRPNNIISAADNLGVGNVGVIVA